MAFEEKIKETICPTDGGQPINELLCAPICMANKRSTFNRLHLVKWGGSEQESKRPTEGPRDDDSGKLDFGTLSFKKSIAAVNGFGTSTNQGMI